VNGNLFTNIQDIELSAGVDYELRASGYCIVDPVEDSPLTPAGYVSFLRPAN